MVCHCLWSMGPMCSLKGPNVAVCACTRWWTEWFFFCPFPSIPQESIRRTNRGQMDRRFILSGKLTGFSCSTRHHLFQSMPTVDSSVFILVSVPKNNNSRLLIFAFSIIKTLIWVWSDLGLRFCWNWTWADELNTQILIFLIFIFSFISFIYNSHLQPCWCTAAWNWISWRTLNKVVISSPSSLTPFGDLNLKYSLNFVSQQHCSSSHTLQMLYSVFVSRLIHCIAGCPLQIQETVVLKPFKNSARDFHPKTGSTDICAADRNSQKAPGMKIWNHFKKAFKSQTWGGQKNKLLPYRRHLQAVVLKKSEYFSVLACLLNDRLFWILDHEQNIGIYLRVCAVYSYSSYSDACSFIASRGQEA